MEPLHKILLKATGGSLRRKWRALENASIRNYLYLDPNESITWLNLLYRDLGLLIFWLVCQDERRWEAAISCPKKHNAEWNIMMAL